MSLCDWTVSSLGQFLFAQNKDHPDFQNFADHTSPLREGGACGSAKPQMTWMNKDTAYKDIFLHTRRFWINEREKGV